MIEGLDSKALKRQRRSRRGDLLPFGPHIGEERARLKSCVHTKDGFKGESVTYVFEVLSTTRAAAVKVGKTYATVINLSGEGSFKHKGSGPKYFAGVQLVNSIAAWLGVEREVKKVTDPETDEEIEVEDLPETFSVNKELRGMCRKGEALEKHDLQCIIKTTRRLAWEKGKPAKGGKRVAIMDPETGKQKVYFDRYWEIAPEAEGVATESEDDEDEDED